MFKSTTSVDPMIYNFMFVSTITPDDSNIDQKASDKATDLDNYII